MPRNKPPTTEADLFAEALRPERVRLSRVAARTLLELEPSPRQEKRLSRLMSKRRADTLTAAEREELDNLVRVGNIISLLQAHARVTLQKPTAARRE